MNPPHQNPKYSQDKSECCVVVPLYQEALSPLEKFNISTSMKNLRGFSVAVCRPSKRKVADLSEIIPNQILVEIPDEYFNSIENYSRLLLNPEFYRVFRQYKYILILQTDAILLTPCLLDWCHKGYDYIGAPIGVQITVNTPGLLDEMIPKHSLYQHILPQGTVGNGGLSLRNVDKAIQLIESHPKLVSNLSNTGMPEDILFMVAGLGMLDFRVPNETTAATFSIEMNGPGYFARGLNNPFGLHGWAKYDRPFWEHHFRNLGVN